MRGSARVPGLRIPRRAGHRGRGGARGPDDLELRRPPRRRAGAARRHPRGAARRAGRRAGRAGPPRRARRRRHAGGGADPLRGAGRRRGRARRRAHRGRPAASPTPAPRPSRPSPPPATRPSARWPTRAGSTPSSPTGPARRPSSRWRRAGPPTTASSPRAAPSRPGWCPRPRSCGRRTPRPPASSTTAEAETDRLRHECDAYVDAKLAEMEDMLGKALATVTRGRSQLWRGAPGGRAAGPHRHGHGPHRLTATIAAAGDDSGPRWGAAVAPSRRSSVSRSPRSCAASVERAPASAWRPPVVLVGEPAHEPPSLQQVHLPRDVRPGDPHACGDLADPQRLARLVRAWSGSQIA